MKNNMGAIHNRIFELNNVNTIAKAMAVIILVVGVTIYGIDKVDDMNGPEPGDPKSLEPDHFVCSFCLQQFSQTFLRLLRMLL